MIVWRGGQCDVYILEIERRETRRTFTGNHSLSLKILSVFIVSILSIHNYNTLALTRRVDFTEVEVSWEPLFVFSCFSFVILVLLRR